MNTKEELKEKDLNDVTGGKLDNIKKLIKNDSEGLNQGVVCNKNKEEELGGNIHINPTDEHTTPFIG